jgi:hypothetical protein
MQAGLSPPRTERAKHRHELRTLTYVTLDQANGGIVRNLSHEGIAVQAVAALRPQQQLRVRFELRYPRLRVEARGEVAWATLTGQCGIRFLDLSPRLTRQIDEWIFGNLLEGASLDAEKSRSIFAETSLLVDQEDGLLVSPAPQKVIALPMRSEHWRPVAVGLGGAEMAAPAPAPLDWLSQPLSGRSLIWTINTLVVIAALLLFVMVFLSVTREPPKWPLTMAAGAIVFVSGLYWGFFAMFGGLSPGERLARLVGSDAEDEEPNGPRFR